MSQLEDVPQQFDQQRTIPEADDITPPIQLSAESATPTLQSPQTSGQPSGEIIATTPDNQQVPQSAPADSPERINPSLTVEPRSVRSRDERTPAAPKPISDSRIDEPSPVPSESQESETLDADNLHRPTLQPESQRIPPSENPVTQDMGSRTKILEPREITSSVQEVDDFQLHQPPLDAVTPDHAPSEFQGTVENPIGATPTPSDRQAIQKPSEPEHVQADMSLNPTPVKPVMGSEDEGQSSDFHSMAVDEARHAPQSDPDHVRLERAPTREMPITSEQARQRHAELESPVVSPGSNETERINNSPEGPNDSAIRLPQEEIDPEQSALAHHREPAPHARITSFWHRSNEVDGANSESAPSGRRNFGEEPARSQSPRQDAPATPSMERISDPSVDRSPPQSDGLRNAPNRVRQPEDTRTPNSHPSPTETNSPRESRSAPNTQHVGTSESNLQSQQREAPETRKDTPSQESNQARSNTLHEPRRTPAPPTRITTNTEDPPAGEQNRVIQARPRPVPQLLNVQNESTLPATTDQPNHDIERPTGHTVVEQNRQRTDRPSPSENPAIGAHISPDQHARMNTDNRADRAERASAIKSSTGSNRTRGAQPGRIPVNHTVEQAESDSPTDRPTQANQDNSIPKDSVRDLRSRSRDERASLPPVNPTTRRGARSEDQDSLPPRVYISRVEVRHQPTPPPANERRPRRRTPALSLDDYLRQRNAGRH